MSEENNRPLDAQFVDVAHQYLMKPSRLNLKRLFSVLFIMVASAAYTFSAMPSTVNFYRSIVPPIEIKTEQTSDNQKSTTEKALEKTNEIINVSQVYAVPSLLAILEIISIFLAIEFWRQDNKDKSRIAIFILFLFCQSYPVISVIFQIADANRVASEKVHIKTSENTTVRIENKNSDLSAERDNLKSLQEQRTTLLKDKDTSKQIIEKQDKLIADQREKIEEIIKSRDNLTIRTEDNVVQDKINSSVISFWLNNLFSKEMFIAYFLSALFPITLLSLGYYRAKIFNN